MLSFLQVMKLNLAKNKGVKIMNKIAYKCSECGIINVFDEGFGDGERCLKCGGFILPIGEAKVKSRHERVLKLKIDVDDSQLDKALEKIKEIKTNMEERSGLFND